MSIYISFHPTKELDIEFDENDGAEWIRLRSGKGYITIHIEHIKFNNQILFAYEKYLKEKKH